MVFQSKIEYINVEIKSVDLDISKVEMITDEQ